MGPELSTATAPLTSKYVYNPIPPEMLIVMVPSDPDPQDTSVVVTPVMIMSCARRDITDEIRTRIVKIELLNTFIE